MKYCRYLIYTWLEQVDDRKSKLVYGWMKRQTGEWTSRRAGGWTGKCVNGHMNGWLR